VGIEPGQFYRPHGSLRIDYKKSLNPQQLAAVTAPDGPALVIAGAGSGKTRTLTYRVAYLIERGVPPDQLLLLTFTNKAADEMMNRVKLLLGAQIVCPWGGTFHSVANKILRQHSHLIGYNNNYTILDREDSLDLVKACLKELDVDIKPKVGPRAEVITEIISKAANTAASIEQTIQNEYPYLTPYISLIKQTSALYEQKKRESNLMDFDDLLVKCKLLMEEFPEILRHYQERFQHILVDEYQDTNKLQSELVDLLASRHRNIMVVGDDAQSIYGWRGANFENILTFPSRYPGTRIYRIEYNYRSTPEILAVANASIANNPVQHRKKLTPIRPAGKKPTLIICRDPIQQAWFIANKIREFRETGLRLADIAVLYRSHFHAMEVQLELTRAGIPFVITSGIRFFEQSHVKDVTVYLKLLVNPRDELAFRRLTLMLPGIGPKTFDKLWRAYLSKLEALKGPECQNDPSNDTNSRSQAWESLPEVLAAISNHVPSPSKTEWAKLVGLFKTIQALGPQLTPAPIIRKIMEAYLDNYIRLTYSNYLQRLEDIDELIAYAEQFKSTNDFLAQLALLTNLESEETLIATYATDAVRLSTVHQAKGLEFEVVFLIMLCDGLFPNARAMGIPGGLYEERRLFYVGITRAKTHLFIFYPECRRSPGSQGLETLEISRFLSEIPWELFEVLDLRSYNTPGFYSSFVSS